MQWLLHGSVTSAAANALKNHEQKVHDLSEADLAFDASPESVLRAAAGRQWDIITADPSLARAPFELGIAFHRCIVFLNVTGDVEQDDAVDRLYARYKRLTPGRLYTVTASRVKIRQLPTRHKPPKIASELAE